MRTCLVRLVPQRHPGKEGLPLAGSVDDRDVGRDVPIDQPAEQQTATIRLIGRETGGFDAQSGPGASYQRLGRRYLGCEAGGVASTSKMQSVLRSSRELMAYA